MYIINNLDFNEYLLTVYYIDIEHTLPYIRNVDASTIYIISDTQIII